VSVDNRYTGVGYEPAFETPSDKDFIASHIEALESRVRELEDERDRLKEENGECKKLLATRVEADRLSEANDTIIELRASHASLVAAVKLLSSMVGTMMVRMTYCREILIATNMPSNKVLSMLDITTDKEIYDEITIKSALAEVKGEKIQNANVHIAALIEAVKDVLITQTPETLLNLSDALVEVGG